MSLTLDAQSVWCRLHKTTLEIDPNRVFALATQRLFDFAVRDHRIMLECGMTETTPALETKLQGVLEAHSPLCCFVKSDDLDHVFKEAYWGKYQAAQADMLRREAVRRDIASRVN